MEGGGKRKRVSMNFTTPQKKKKVVAPPRLKHRIFSHAKGKTIGTASMASTPIVRAYTRANSEYKIRALGQEMEDTLEESPPSLLIEGESEDLFKRMEQLEQRVHLLEDHNHIL